MTYAQLPVPACVCRCPAAGVRSPARVCVQDALAGRSPPVLNVSFSEWGYRQERDSSGRVIPGQVRCAAAHPPARPRDRGGWELHLPLLLAS